MRRAMRNLLVTGLLLGGGIAQAAERVGDFSLLDQNGVFHHMGWYEDSKAIAFLVQVNGSVDTRAAMADYQALAARFAEQGIEFMLINPLGEERASVKAQAGELGTELPILIDDAGIVAQAMGVDTSGEAFLYDPRSFSVIYRGSLAGLASAAEDVVAGRSVSTPSVAVQGAPVSYPARHAEVSYSREVSPILAENCASCHREGGIAPFAMDSHAMVQGWSPMIREVLMTKRMPPGQIDPHVGHFSNDYVLAVEDQQKLIDWIAAGAQKDGDADPLAQLEWPATKWALGEPDMIIKVPPQTIPATGVLDYITVEVPIELDRDRWVRASQYIPGDRTVLHHTLNELVAPGARRMGFLGGGDPEQANITPYIPGAEPAIEPPNTGGLLKVGSTLRLQLHYTTNGKETVDASEIGVWFYPDDQIPQERMSGQCACIFPMGWTNIPPYDPAFEQSKSVVLEQDVYMQSFLPHMHFRGKSMRFTAYYPDGREEQLINIANYNYNWQIAYQLEEPKFLPAGTRIEAVGTYDNSTRNKSNPDPAREVPWGDQSWDEMFFGAMSWKNADQLSSR
ncbi:MAG: redoxin domain-containing protein [Pseudomonadales bacterium]|nr:redoxin domain-containing protein [Pseudomonadales bacterium]MCP5330631.1 redoxin domain-containing protein [Pseudomonadales bacterium]